MKANSCSTLPHNSANVGVVFDCKHPDDSFFFFFFNQPKPGFSSEVFWLQWMENVALFLTSASGCLPGVCVPGVCVPGLLCAHKPS